MQADNPPGTAKGSGAGPRWWAALGGLLRRGGRADRRQRAKAQEAEHRLEAVQRRLETYVRRPSAVS